MSDQFRTTYYALDPRGPVRRIKTRTIGDLRGLDGVCRMNIIYGYPAKDEAEFAGEFGSKIFEKVLRLNVIQHEIQNAFLEANGTFVDHDTADAFFEAIGYVGHSAANANASLPATWKRESCLGRVPLHRLRTVRSEAPQLQSRIRRLRI